MSVKVRQRKSFTRRPRKLPLVTASFPLFHRMKLTNVQSEEIISLEDELDEPMVMGEIMTPAVASPLPLRSGEFNSQLSSRPVRPSP